MPFYKYEKEELESYTVKQLRRLCSYYGVQVLASWSKSRIIQAILEYIPPSQELFDPAYNPSKEVNQSVRVARIAAAMKGYEDE